MECQMSLRQLGFSSRIMLRLDLFNAKLIKQGKLLFVNPPPGCGITSKEFNKKNYDNYNWEDPSPKQVVAEEGNNNGELRTHKSKRKKKANKKRNEVKYPFVSFLNPFI